MNFKNDFEKTIFDATKEIFGESAKIEHNKVLRIESALYSEVASFTGPPKKEIDVITVNFGENPVASLLISCKDFTNKAEPAHVQEWAAVLNAMSKYSNSTKYFGLVICSKGFTSGCESWATSSNLALIPPIKGKSLQYSKTTVIDMFKRSVTGFKKRLNFSFDELTRPPSFYEFIYNLTSDFEGFEEHRAETGSRYLILPNNWTSSFSELVNNCVGKIIKEVISTSKYLGLQFEDSSFFLIDESKLLFGKSNSLQLGADKTPNCYKNLSMQNCDLEFIKGLIINKKVSSAGDFNTHFEFGIDSKMNIGFYPNNQINIISTVNPIKENEL